MCPRLLSNSKKFDNIEAMIAKSFDFSSLCLHHGLNLFSNCPSLLEIYN